MFQIFRPAKRLPRRTVLKSSSATIALPWLEAMSPAGKLLAAAPSAGVPKRAVFCMWGLGINGREFTPAETGHDYSPTPILKPVDRFRDSMTVISGLMLTHSGGHRGDRTFLTGTNTHEAGAKLRISCDQELAQAIGTDTRYPSLQLGIRRGTGFGGGPQDHTLSWSKSGMPIPAENRPQTLFDRLFRPETPETVRRRESEFAERASVLDDVRQEARQLQSTLGKGDRERMDAYLSSIRDLEVSIARDKQWLYEPKPQVDQPGFGSDQGLDPDKGGLDYRRYQRLMFDVITLALQTDSTRVISYMPRMDNSDGTNAYRSEGNPYGYHEMTHHGEDPDKLKWLTKCDRWYMEEWAYFLERLSGVQEGEGTLLDNSIVVWGSTGGTQNAHHNKMLPAIVCGGSGHGIRHQGHLKVGEQPLGNLWQTIFNAYGVPVPENFQGGEAGGIIDPILG